MDKLFFLNTIILASAMTACQTQSNIEIDLIAQAKTQVEDQAKTTEDYYNNLSENYNQYYDQHILSYFDEGYQLIPISVDPANYLAYDFTPLIQHSKNAVNIGIIGDNNKRLKISIDKVKQTADGEYAITGTSWVKDNLCNFSGKLILSKVYQFEHFDFGVDDEYKHKGLTKQGVAVFDYQLNEDESQKDSGIFTGRLYVKYYVLSDNSIHYDDIGAYSDGYFNNLYYGSWQGYHSEYEKQAIWADYRLPNSLTANNDLNIAAGGFNPNPKYLNLGWAEYLQESLK